MSATMRRALVTGAGGFLGRHLLRELAARGIEVWTLGRRRPDGVASATHLVLDDPADGAAIAEALRRAAPDAVFHLAGTATAPLPALYAVNTLFGAALLAAAAALPTRPRIFLAGSAAEYGPVPDAALPVTEATPAQPRDGYGISKLAQTLHGMAAAERGLGVVIGRLFNVVGPGMPTHLALGAFAAQLRRLGPQGGVLETGDLDVERDFVEAGAAVRLMIDLVARTEVTGVVNLCSGAPTSLRMLLDALLRQIGAPVEVRHDPNRRGITAIRRHYGVSERLAGLGLPAPRLDPERAMAAIAADIRRGDAHEPLSDAAALRPDAVGSSA